MKQTFFFERSVFKLNYPYSLVERMKTMTTAFTIQQLPLYTISTVWHVGSMEVSQKNSNSHEGSGLSVSECPHDWVRIARIDGAFHELKHANGQFLDYHQTTEEQRDIMKQWGVQQGYITLQTLYESSHYDDEMESSVFGLHATYEEAYEESYEEKEAVKELPNQPVATERMKERVMGNAHPVLVMQLLATLYAEDVLELQGVWFHDEYDPSSYSAPRGVIVPSRIHEWSSKIRSEHEAPYWGDGDWS